MNAEDLIAAVLDRSSRKLRKALKSVDVNAPGHQKGWTALHWAVQQGDASMVRELLAAGADPRARGGLGDSPLQLAVVAERPDPAIFRLLLEAGADRTQENNYGVSPLEFAQRIDGFPIELLDAGRP